MYEPELSGLCYIMDVMANQAQKSTESGMTRYQVLTWCFFVALAVIFVQLFRIQIIDHDKYCQAGGCYADRQTNH